MHPDRVARLFAILGIYLLLTVLGLRVFSLVTIALQARMGVNNTQLSPIIPTIGNYSLSPDGRQVRFQRQIAVNGDTSWFSMPLEGGPAAPSTAPETGTDPFLVKDDQLFLLEGTDYTLINGSPRDTRVGAYARSPDGKAFAFAAYRPGGTWGLYVLYDTGKLDWLGDQEQIEVITWSPGNQELAFTAISKGTVQVFVARRDGQNLQQITTDSTHKTQPRWSPDGQKIAFIVSTGESIRASEPTPTEPPPHGSYHPEEPTLANITYGIGVVEASGANAQLYLLDDRIKFDLSWGMSETGAEVVYAQPLPDDPRIYYLYGLNPGTGKSRRVYPPQKITALHCPTTIPSNAADTVSISIANSGLRSADVHILLRASPQRFPYASKMNSNVIRSENVQVPGGAIQTVDWPVTAQPGLFTHFSVIINPDAVLPMDEERCIARNTLDNRLAGLPNLPYLPLALPLSTIGLLFCIPWLRRQPKPALWALYLAIPLFSIIILVIEVYIVRMHLS